MKLTQNKLKRLNLIVINQRASIKVTLESFDPH